MMEFIAHRGYWKEKSQQNTLSSFELAIDKGYGIETDLRDLDGKVVISHDPPAPSVTHRMYFEDLLRYYVKKNSSVTLALNVKADGISTWVKELLIKYNVKNYFIFDCSVPELLRYRKAELNYYSRESDIETVPSLYDQSKGIWLDQFANLWFNESDIRKHLEKGKSVCVVSSDLHGRDYKECWSMLKGLRDSFKHVSLCTDFPDEAKEFFSEKN
jgi:hypothetical protein